MDFRDVKFALGDVLISDLGRLVPASDNTDVRSFISLFYANYHLKTNVYFDLVWKI